MPDTTFGYSTRSGTSLQQRLPSCLARDAAAAAPRLAVELAGDAFLALGSLEHDEVFGEPLAIVVEPLDLDRAPGAAARRQKAMAEGDGARSDLLHQRTLRAAACDKSKTARRGRRKKQDPANRPAERQLALAVVERRVPPHRLGERQFAQQTRQHVGQHVDGGLAASCFRNAR